MAVHLYTASRVTTDVDAEFGARVLFPNDLMVEVTLEDGTPQVVYLDTTYNSSFALMHEDYLDDSIPLDLGVSQIRLHVLSPVDLAVSKIARLADNDKGGHCCIGPPWPDKRRARSNNARRVPWRGMSVGRPCAAESSDAVALARQAEVERHGRSRDGGTAGS
jgi:hypothetical protein